MHGHEIEGPPWIMALIRDHENMYRALRYIRCEVASMAERAEDRKERDRLCEIISVTNEIERGEMT